MAGRKKGMWARRTENEWRSLLLRFEASGLGVEAFCQREAISAASFYRWRGMLRDGRGGGDAVGNATAPAFVDLGALNSESSPGPRLDLKLDLGDGLILHLVRR